MGIFRALPPLSKRCKDRNYHIVNYPFSEDDIDKLSKEFVNLQFNTYTAKELKSFLNDKNIYHFDLWVDEVEDRYYLSMVYL